MPNEQIQKAILDILLGYKKGVAKTQLFGVFHTKFPRSSEESFNDEIMKLQLERKVFNLKGVMIHRNFKLSAELDMAAEEVEKESVFKIGETRGRFDANSKSITAAVVYAFWFFRDENLSHRDLRDIVAEPYMSAIGIRSAVLALIREKPFPYITQVGYNGQGRPLFKWSGNYGYPLSIQRAIDADMIKRTTLGRQSAMSQYPAALVDDFIKEISESACLLSDQSTSPKKEEITKIATQLLKQIVDFKNTIEEL